MAFIYKLSFPNDERVYIGQTTRSVEARLQEHHRKLKAGAHPNSKLQNHCSTYSILPNIDIIAECSILELDTIELAYITKFNSYKNGFNATPGGTSGGKGENHPNSLYNIEDYSCVLLLLSSTNLTHREIFLETGVSVGVIEGISCGQTHTYLKEVYPTEYAKMTSKNKKSKVEWKNIVDPSGIVHSVPCAESFAKSHKLDSAALKRVLHGTASHHLGWHLEGTNPIESKKEYTIISPEGTLFKVTNIKQFGDMYGLNDASLGRLLKGLRKSDYKGWRLPTIEELNNANN